MKNKTKTTEEISKKNNIEKGNEKINKETYIYI
jgi:hypothetical protein